MPTLIHPLEFTAPKSDVIKTTTPVKSLAERVSSAGRAALACFSRLIGWFTSIRWVQSLLSCFRSRTITPIAQAPSTPPIAAPDTPIPSPEPEPAAPAQSTPDQIDKITASPKKGWSFRAVVTGLLGLTAIAASALYLRNPSAVVVSTTNPTEPLPVRIQQTLCDDPLVIASREAAIARAQEQTQKWREARDARYAEQDAKRAEKQELRALPKVAKVDPMKPGPHNALATLPRLPMTPLPGAHNAVALRHAEATKLREETPSATKTFEREMDSSRFFRETSERIYAMTPGPHNALATIPSRPADVFVSESPAHPTPIGQPRDPLAHLTRVDPSMQVVVREEPKKTEEKTCPEAPPSFFNRFLGLGLVASLFGLNKLSKKVDQQHQETLAAIRDSAREAQEREELSTSLAYRRSERVNRRLEAIEDRVKQAEPTTPRRSELHNGQRLEEVDLDELFSLETEQ